MLLFGFQKKKTKGNWNFRFFARFGRVHHGSGDFNGSSYFFKIQEELITDLYIVGDVYILFLLKNEESSREACFMMSFDQCISRDSM